MGSATSGPMRTESLAWTFADCRCIHIGDLVRAGLVDGTNRRAELSWGESDLERGEVKAVIEAGAGPVLVVRFTIREMGTEESGQRRVPLAYSPIPYGGRRSWLVCPVCRARVAIVAMTPGGAGFGCRHCLHLAHPSRTKPRSRGSREAAGRDSIENATWNR